LGPPRKETNWALLFFVPIAKAKGACKLLCKKILTRILGPLGPRAPPHCGVCGVTIYATEVKVTRSPNGVQHI